jgi:sigma-E factor negative regulatory protein RseC
VKEKGRISEIHGKMVSVFCGEIAACFGCMNQECRSNKRVITAENRNHFDLSLGQLVVIEHSSAGAFMQFVQAIMLPLVGFAAAFFMMKFLFPASNNGIRVVIGLVFLFLSGFAIYVYRKKVPAKNNPCVIKVL